MQSLPLDVIPIIFRFIKKKTDKRQFTKTCKIYNDITKKLIEGTKFQCYFRKNYALLLTAQDFIMEEYGYCRDFYSKLINSFLFDTNYCMEKFTYELCCDSYSNLIPKKYLVPENEILTDSLIICGNLELLQIAIRNGCILSENAYEMAKNLGHFDIVEFIFEYNNDFEQDCNDCAYDDCDNNNLVFV